jgi:error-prone DNA polymerase
VDGVQHLIVRQMYNIDSLIEGVRTHSRDFH